MEMNKVKYNDLILRFSKELYDVGVTCNMKKLVEDQYSRTPNISSCNASEAVRKFTYLHDGYMIEAVQTVTLKVKKCK